MVLHIHTITVDDAVDVICHTAGVKDFQATPESKKAMDDLVLATEVRSAVIDLNHGIKISARDGIVFVKSEATPLQQSPLIHDIEKIVKEIPGVKDMRIDVEPIFPLSE
jgi:superfamily II DNA/RNA helicase